MSESLPISRFAITRDQALVKQKPKTIFLAQDISVVAICVCTYKRPEMLRRCLSAIANALENTIRSIEPVVIVIDNDPAASAKTIFEGIVETFADQGLSTIYIQEARRGITMARNAALEKAVTLDADFIAFVDDDAWPDKDWLNQLVRVQRGTGADIVRAQKHLVYPEPVPFWIVTKRRDPFAAKNRASSVHVRHMAAGEVLISAKLFRDWSLRFDNRFALTSGEDTEFFTRAALQGASMVASDLPVMFEEVVPERCTYWAQVKRQFQYATGNTMIDRDHGRSYVAFGEALTSLLSGAWWVLVSPLAALGGLRRFKRSLLRGGRKVAYALGQVTVLCGYKYTAYAKTDGY